MKRLLRGGVDALLVLGFILVPFRTTEGCIFSANHESYRIFFFVPSINLPSDLDPFIFNQNYLIEYDADPEDLDHWKNSQEWAANFKGVSAGEVYKVIYNTSGERFLSYLKTNQLKEHFKGNQFVKKLLLPKNRDYLDYLIFAFEIEFRRNYDQNLWGDSWNALPKQFNEKWDQLFLKAKKRLSSTKTPFIQQRYAYQLIKYAELDNDQKFCLDTYHKYFSDKKAQSSILHAWLLNYLGNLAIRHKEYLKGCQFLAKSFDQSALKKPLVVQHFPHEYLDTLLLQSKNKNDQALFLVMNSLSQKGPALNRLQQLASLAPQSKYWTSLLGREINKLEDWLLTPRLTFYSKYEDWLLDPVKKLPPEEEVLPHPGHSYLRVNEQKDIKYGKKLLALVKQLLVHKQSKVQKDWLHLATAQIAILTKQPLLAQKHINAVVAPADQIIKWQKTVQHLLLLPQVQDISKDDVQTQIAILFRELQENKKQLPHEWGVYPKLLLFYSRKFHAKNDLVTAGLLYNRARSVPVNARVASEYYHPIAYFDRYSSLKDLNKLLRLREKGPNTHFEHFLLAPCTEAEKKHYEHIRWTTIDQKWLDTYGWALPTNEALLDLKGTLAFRERRYKVARETFSKLPLNYWQNTYEFKYFLKKDIFSIPQKMAWQGRATRSFSKATALTHWVELEKQAIGTDREKAAEAHYLLGNACYNTSYWGSSWMMFSYGRTDAEPIGTKRDDWHIPAFWAQSKRFFAQYYCLSDAIHHYQKVLEFSKDKELKARATYMLIACDKISHRAYAFAASNKDYWEREEPNYRSPYAHFFKKHFTTTKIYKARFSTCPTLKDYF
jgi:hypothetical protein